MKLIKQDFNIVNQQGFSIKDIKKHIEYCARISYKSQDKITDTSYEKFVSMLEKRDHARPLEFGTVHLQMYISDFHKLRDTLCINNMWNDQWIKYHYVGELTYVTTNYRYYLAIIKVFPSAENDFDPQDDELYPKRYTVHFITSRGVMDEFRTHVGLSHLAESTRYCNYSNDKFGNQLTFIIPCCVDAIEDEYYLTHNDDIISSRLFPNMTFGDLPKTPFYFLYSLLIAEKSYFNLLKTEHWTPQQAREVLPLSVKSELISCGFEDAWENFMRRRSPKYGDPGAHPMAAEIADKLCEEFLKRGFIDEKKVHTNPNIYKLHTDRSIFLYSKKMHQKFIENL